MSKIAVCILHYGDPGLTRRLEHQFLNSDPGTSEHVYVLDNAAPVAYEGAWIRKSENLYWTGALCFALQEFRQMGYTHLWFFNNDAYFLSKPPYIKRTAGRLERMENLLGKVGIYAPAVTANPYHPQMVQNQEFQCRLISYADGIAPLVNLTCVEEVGGLDVGDNIYGYGVDVWFSLKVKEAGWNVLLDHQVLIKHNYHATAKKTDGFLEKAAIAEHEFLTERLGPDFRQTLKQLQEQWQDVKNL